MTPETSVVERLKKEDIKYVDLRFTDLLGTWHHISVDASRVSAEIFQQGLAFDGSSIPGWKDIHESDMLLMPDATTTRTDPFFAFPTLSIICSVIEPETGKPYSRDPRSVAKRAEEYLRSTGIADSAYVGPEGEFFAFDSVRFSVDPYKTGFTLDGYELPDKCNAHLNGNNFGHRPRMKEGYLPLPPIDSGQDMRGEMLSAMATMGVVVEKHHHEVASAQHELGIRFGSLLPIADAMQIYKYCVHNVAQTYGKTATFMPKPVYGDNGSGLHIHQSLWKGKTPLFSGSEYADLSQECLWYIGGILKHGRALNAFTNPTTNSYKRLVPGFEAPIFLAYSARNRSAACRIPWGKTQDTKRVEIRFPDPTANAYLAFTAILMAGLDGIRTKCDPGEAVDKNLYELPEQEIKKIPTLCTSLEEAIDSLKKDNGFLKEGGVFTDDLINAYCILKMKEVHRLAVIPHPVEFDMYYSS
jgi:glutamine synthetase